MREESRNWWAQALADLKAGESNLESAQYFVCAFLSQQAAEKALKAVYIERLRQAAPKSHNLVRLGQELSLPSDLVSALRHLNPAYTTSRYPDAANGLPVEAFDRGMAEALLRDATEVVDWARRELGQP